MYKHLLDNYLKGLILSSVARRIVTLNVIALIVMVFGILYLNQFENSLIESNFNNLKLQSKLVSEAIVFSIEPHSLKLENRTDDYQENCVEENDELSFFINPATIMPILRQTIDFEKTQARIYDSSGQLLIDTDILYKGNHNYNKEKSFLSEHYIVRIFSQILEYLFSRHEWSLDKENSLNNSGSQTIQKAISGKATLGKWRNTQGDLILTITLPIKKANQTIGILSLLIHDTNIDSIVYNERIIILKIFLGVLSVMLILSLFLASTIARPLRILAEVTNQVCYGVTKKIHVPDFSDRKDEVGQLSIALQKMTEALYDRIESTEKFAADVSHELKNPITSLQSVIETFPIAKTGQAQNKLLSIMQHDVRRLSRLITDIAKASLLEAEFVRTDFEIVDLEKLLNNLVKIEFNSKPQKKTVKLNLTVFSLPSYLYSFSVLGHELRLSQVFFNIIDNALSFLPNEKGIINIALEAVSNSIKISIEDNGIGIRTEDTEKIFQRFYTDRPGKENFGLNSGLGLSISQQIIEAHGGSISAENIFDATNIDRKLGARFIIQLPIHKTQK